MPTEIRWDDDEMTILAVTFIGDIPRDEYLAIFDQESEMFASVSHVAYIIADFTHVGRMPVDILSLSSMISRQLPPNLGGIVFVGTNTVLDTLFRIWSKLYRKMSMVRTRDEAYLWIDERRVLKAE